MKEKPPQEKTKTECFKYHYKKWIPNGYIEDENNSYTLRKVQK